MFKTLEWPFLFLYMNTAFLLSKIKEFRNSVLAKKLLSYFFFVIMSAIFWMFNAANKNHIQDIELPLQIVNVPDSVLFLSNPPSKLYLTVQESGLNSLFRRKSVITINFNEYDLGNGFFKVNSQQLNALVREKYSKESSVNSVLPDSISLRYVDPRVDVRRVPIILDFSATANMQYEIVGETTMSSDSVTIYANRDVLSSVAQVYTYHVEETELTDTLRRKIAIAQIPNARIEPSEVLVTVPVEKLIKKVRTIPITVKNRPDNVNLITFPTMVKVSYLVPKNQYNNSDLRITAIVDYNDVINSPKTNKIELRLGEVPMAYKNVSLETDSVEYIIERLSL